MTILFVWLEGNASDLMAEFVLLASFQLKIKLSRCMMRIKCIFYQINQVSARIILVGKLSQLYLYNKNSWIEKRNSWSIR